MLYYLLLRAPNKTLTLGVVLAAGDGSGSRFCWEFQECKQSFKACEVVSPMDCLHPQALGAGDIFFRVVHEQALLRGYI